MSDKDSSLRDLERRVAYLIHDTEPALVSCQSLLRLVERGQFDSNKETHRRLLQSSRNALLFAEKLLQQMLETTRLRQATTALHLEQIEAKSLLEGGVQAIVPLAQERAVKLELVCEKYFFFQSDFGLLVRIIQNLVLNALKNVPTGSTIHLKLSQADESLHLLVEDEGPGLPEEALQRIFDEHEQLNLRDKRRYAGVGLGLSFCMESTERLGGSIQVENRQPQGLRFLITLPLQLST